MDPMLSGSFAGAVLFVSLLLLALIIATLSVLVAVAGVKPVLREIRDDQKLVLLELRRMNAGSAERAPADQRSRGAGLRAERP